MDAFGESFLFGRSTALNLEEPRLLNPISLVVGDVVEEPEDSVGIDPSVGTDDGAVGSAMLLAVLAAFRLEAEETIFPLVRLDVVLQVRVR